MPQFRDFQAAVVVDEVELPEYTIEVSEEDDKISCYIPSEVGKNFAVRWRDLGLQRSTVGKVYLDGASVARRSIIKGSNPREASPAYYRVTNDTVRPFCFELLSLTDDESCANPAENNLGEIRIELYEVLSRKIVPFPHVWKPDCVPGVVRIHEHSKKMMMHCVGYGADTKSIQRKWFDSVKGERLATFVFRYQALDMLQAQGIAPPPPPPPVPGSSTQREKKRQRCKEEVIEVIDDGEADKAMLKILKSEISKIEARLQKRQKTEVKSEDNAPVIANEVIELE